MPVFHVWHFEEISECRVLERILAACAMLHGVAQSPRYTNLDEFQVWKFGAVTQTLEWLLHTRRAYAVGYVD